MVESKNLIIWFLLLVCLGCGRPTATIYTLPSGKQIKVISITRMDFPKGDPALVMTYESDISIEDKTKLREEVNEIWAIFQNDVESADLKAGAVRAVNYRDKFGVRTGQGYGFVFIKQPDGTWLCLDDSDRREK